MAPAPSTASAPSLSEPATTPGWAEAGPHGATVAQQNGERRYSHRYRAPLYMAERASVLSRQPRRHSRDRSSLAASPIWVR